jgi:hypothetical protein
VRDDDDTIVRRRRHIAIRMPREFPRLRENEREKVADFAGDLGPANADPISDADRFEVLA